MRVLVAGAGPAGAVAAIVLARAGVDVWLTDPQPVPGRRIGEALPGIARRLLDSIGLGAVLDGHARSPGTVSVWRDGKPRAVDFLTDPHGEGYHLDRAAFDLALRQRAVAVSRFLPIPARVSRDAGGFLAQLGSQWVRFDGVVDATGRSASVARKLGAVRTRDAELTAVYAWGPCDAPDARTWVRAVDEGWWYTARLPSGERVWCIHTDTPRRQLAPDDFIEAAAVLGDLAPTHLFEEPRAHEACGARLDRFAGRGWVAVGDAALSFDPLSGQGLYTALYGGLRGARALLAEDSAGWCGRLEAIRAAYLERIHGAYAGQGAVDGPFWRDHAPPCLPT